MAGMLPVWLAKLPPVAAVSCLGVGIGLAAEALRTCVFIEGPVTPPTVVVPASAPTQSAVRNGTQAPQDGPV